jgi:hypothetical protein
MRARYLLIIGVVVVLAAVAGVLIYRNQTKVTDTAGQGEVVVTMTTTVPPSSSAGSSSPADPTTSAAPSTSTPPSSTKPSSSKPTTSASSTPTTTSSADGRPASNVPMKKLKKGEKAPQFIIFSFDGAGSHEKWGEFMEAAKPTDSRFVGFLTGIYLLTTANKDAYTGPGHAQGKASIGFGGEPDEIITEVEDLNKAYLAGHEIGTHYNGHFCDDNPPGGNQWNTADWNSELDQFFEFMTDWKTINNLPDAPDLVVPTSAIKGGRTPCLTGTLDALVPAWKAHDMTYDSSFSQGSGMVWPNLQQGIWEFQMPYVYSPGFDSMVLAMDYNFWVKFNNGADQPDTAPELRQKVKQTYDYMYDQAYNGNRAPIIIANHFNKWNGDSFNPPAKDFMTEKCGEKDTYCATYQDVIAWMELQDPAVLAELQAQPAVATGP